MFEPEGYKDVDLTKDAETLTVWCHQCKQKVKPHDTTLRKIEIRPGSYRSFVKGTCELCNRNVSGIVKSTQKVEASPFDILIV